MTEMTDRQQLDMMENKQCPRCKGLTLYETDPRFCVGHQQLKYYHCLMCGMYAFIKQAEDLLNENWALWWKAVGTKLENRTTMTDTRRAALEYKRRTGKALSMR